MSFTSFTAKPGHNAFNNFHKGCLRLPVIDANAFVTSLDNSSITFSVISSFLSSYASSLDWCTLYVFFADKREKILLFVVGEIVVLVEDIEAVTMLYLETLVGSALFSVFSPTWKTSVRYFFFCATVRFYYNLLNRGQLQKPIIRSSPLTVIFPFELYFREYRSKHVQIPCEHETVFCITEADSRAFSAVLVSCN